MNSQRQGCFVISLDFELLWGVLDHKNPLDYEENIRNVRKVVPALLKLFSKYNIHATWAVVGMMLNNSIEECWEKQPKYLPTYDNLRLSSYEYFDFLKTVDPELLFASSLLEKIKIVNGQEIATHTYSHFFCMEGGQTSNQFEEDIKNVVKIMNCNGINVHSIVFPRNQINSKYTGILKKYSLIRYRGNEKAWFYQSADKEKYTSVLWRICRLIDNYFPLSGHSCYSYDELVENSGLLNIPSSRFFRPYSKFIAFLEPLRIARIKGQMRYAAKNGKIFHLWWHPHNFGKDYDQNIRNLIELLKYYTLLKRKYGFISLNMSEV